MLQEYLGSEVKGGGGEGGGRVMNILLHTPHRTALHPGLTVRTSCLPPGLACMTKDFNWVAVGVKMQGTLASTLKPLCICSGMGLKMFGNSRKTGRNSLVSKKGSMLHDELQTLPQICSTFLSPLSLSD